MFLLDTNVISELRKTNTKKANARVIDWVKHTSSLLVYCSSITMLELEMGVLKKERKDAKQGAHLRAWLDNQVKPAFKDKVLAFDMDAAMACANLHVPDQASDRDAMIASIAIANRLTVVTRNQKDFNRFDVDIINPWNNR